MSVELWISILAGILAILALGILSYRTYQQEGTLPTSSDVSNVLKKIPGLAEELEKVGLMAVASAEQLIEDGTIGSNEQKFEEAFSYVDKWCKEIFDIELDRELIVKIVEGSYRLFKEQISSTQKKGILP